MFSWHTRSNDDSRVIELADTRILLLPRGRGGSAYLIPDHLTGWKLEERLTWIDRGFGVGLVLLVGAASAMNEWRLLLALGPLLAAKVLAERLVLAGLPEATDTAARVEVNRVPAISNLTVASVVGGAILSVVWLWAGVRGSHWFDRMEAILLMTLAVLAAVQTLKRRRAAHELRRFEGPREPDNRPIVPR